MPIRAPKTRLATHEVLNQPPPLEDFNAFSMDRPLTDAIATTAAQQHAAHLTRFGAHVGAAETLHLTQEANHHVPELQPFDRYGQRIDEVEFHPAYHALMEFGLNAEISSIAWTADAGGHAAHIAMMYLMGHADSGVCCPFSMTYAAMPVLRQSDALAREWAPRVTAARYDPRSIPAAEKTGVTIGMAMTEKQGGSDVRANTTQATPLHGDDYLLTGHKWFCSAPMSDGFLTLAHAAGGLTCFFVPRWQPDGTRNAIQIVRLKDKLGDRSNASGEIEFHGAWSQRVGDEGRGIRTIIDMVQGTRLDCMAGSAGIMRAALTQSLWHCAHRSAFGQRLIEQPAMVQVLGDLCLEAEAATALVIRIAASFDAAADDEQAAAFARLATPIAKYWVCKRAPGFVYEAMECLGGAGFVEESSLPRLFRQSPLNSIWEGSGNVIALDVLRALKREPAALAALTAFLDAARGAHKNLDRRIDDWKTMLRDGALHERAARRFVEASARILQAAVLVEMAPGSVTDAFCTARLGDDANLTYGAGGAVAGVATLLERALPVV